MLFGGLAALELRAESFPHVAMTVFGAQRGFDPEVILRVLLERAVSWLEHSSHARVVDLYLYNQDREHERWSDALDSVLDRSRIHVRSNLLCAVCEELVARLPALLPDDRDIRAKVLEPLLEALSGDRPEGIPFQWLTTPCRVFAEYAVERALDRKGYLGKPPRRTSMRASRRCAGALKSGWSTIGTCCARAATSQCTTPRRRAS